MSAGLEPGTLNPYAVRVMQEAGSDISGAPPKCVFDLFKAGQLYSYMVTVCDKEAAERCPIFPDVAKRLHGSFPGPSTVQGNDEDNISQVRAIRDAIRLEIEALANTVQ